MGLHETIRQQKTRQAAGFKGFMELYETTCNLYLVPEVGLEPTSLAAEDFESSASTNSTTRAAERSSMPAYVRGVESFLIFCVVEPPDGVSPAGKKPSMPGLDGVAAVDPRPASR